MREFARGHPSDRSQEQPVPREVAGQLGGLLLPELESGGASVPEICQTRLTALHPRVVRAIERTYRVKLRRASPDKIRKPSQ